MDAQDTEMGCDSVSEGETNTRLAAGIITNLGEALWPFVTSQRADFQKQSALCMTWDFQPIKEKKQTNKKRKNLGVWES